jgi:ABC-2 type transport system ATP-binding protein
MNVVVVDSLRHHYGERIALDGVSFAVAAGECFGLLGPNGGGKTTLFRILTTLLSPCGGRAEVCGRDVVHERAEVRGQLGIVFQSPSLDPYLTVRENLRYGGHLYGLSGRPLEDRIDEMLVRLGVADRADELVKTLSGGLRRRVEIAKCMLHRPALLVLDEPSTGLDPGARIDLWRHLREIVQNDGTTVLLTTHFMEEADRCDRLAILDRGRMAACGTPAELKSSIGGDCIRIESPDAPALRDAIEATFACAATLVGGVVRIEASGGSALAGRIMESFGSRVRSVTIGKPTLEDVFVHHTGHRFDGEAGE